MLVYTRIDMTSSRCPRGGMSKCWRPNFRCGEGWLLAAGRVFATDSHGGW